MRMLMVLPVTLVIKVTMVVLVATVKINAV